MKNISQEQVLNQVVPIPPLEEQIEIVEVLDKQDSTSSRLNNEVENSVRLLVERRAALITAAVTGQLDLRNWQPPELEAVVEVA